MTEVLPNGTFALPNSRRALELPFHLYRSRDMDSLLDAWADPEVRVLGWCMQSLTCPVDVPARAVLLVAAAS